MKALITSLATGLLASAAFAQLWRQGEEAFVDAAQFLSTQNLVVYGAKRSAFHRESKVSDHAEEVVVGEVRGVQVRCGSRAPKEAA